MIDLFDIESYEDGGDEKKLKSKKLSEVLRVRIPPGLLRVVMSHRKLFNDLGFVFETESNGKEFYFKRYPLKLM